MSLRIRTLRAVIGLAVAVGCCLGPAATAEPAEEVEPVGPLILQDALAMALDHSPELEAFSERVRAGDARADQAGKLSNPELDIRVYRLGIDRQDRRLDESRSRVVLSQDLPLGGKRSRRRDLARRERDLAEWDHDAKRREVAADVAGRFAAVLGAQRKVEALRRTVELFEEMRDRIQTLVESGAVRSLEVHRVTRRLGLARIDLAEGEADLASARFRLAATWGGMAPRFTEAVGDLERLRPVPDLETVMQMAQSAPGVERWDTEVARSEAALSLAKSERVPDVTAGAGVRWEQNAADRDYLFDLEFDLPIFDLNRAGVRAARHDLDHTLATRRAAEAAGREAIAGVYYALVESDTRVATLRDEVVPAARAMFKAYRRGLETDARTVGDLLDARRDLARAETDYAEALVDFHANFAALEALVGSGPAETD